MFDISIHIIKRYTARPTDLVINFLGFLSLEQMYQEWKKIDARLASTPCDDDDIQNTLCVCMIPIYLHDSFDLFLINKLCQKTKQKISVTNCRCALQTSNIRTKKKMVKNKGQRSSSSSSSLYSRFLFFSLEKEKFAQATDQCWRWWWPEIRWSSSSFDVDRC